MPTLILSPRYSDDSITLRRAAIDLGWDVMRLASWRCPEDLEPDEPILHGEPLFNTAVAEQLGLTLIEPPEDFLVRLAATFVIDPDGRLRLADRRSEHVACAGGGPVLSAGEMFFSDQRDAAIVEEVTNLSTGYCPEPESWPVVGDALDRLGVVHPGRFTTEILFRLCQGVLRDDDGGNFFEAIVEAYLAAGYGRTDLVGAARSYLFDAQDLTAFGVDWMEKEFG